MKVQQLSDKVFLTLMNNPNTLKLGPLNKILTMMIPFNAPHGIKVVQVGQNFINAKIPYKRKNHNHLRGIHACAIATLGEFCAGMTLVKSFPFSKYRLILSNLEIDYHYQGKTALIGHAKITDEQISDVESSLKDSDKTLIVMETRVADKSDNDVATVKSTWQIKEWSNVKTKR